MNINIRSGECAWYHVEVMLLGRLFTGLRGFEYKKTVEKELIYGSGNEPIDINHGNKKVEGNFKMLGYERDALKKAAQAVGYSDLTEVPHEAITAIFKYKKSALDPITIEVVNGIAFTEDGSSMEQGAKMRECTLPFVAMNLT